jgi:acyl dehydratase
MSIFNEMVPVGKKFVSPGRTIGEGEFSLLTTLTWTTSEIHSNAEYMKDTQFGERILAGPCVLALLIGLAGRGPFQHVLRQDGLHTIAMLGMDEVRFKNPMLPGDTITAHSEVLEVRPSNKNPKRAIIRIKDSAVNQKGELLVEAIRASMVELKEG